jgi:hypothetical protein
MHTHTHTHTNKQTHTRARAPSHGSLTLNTRAMMYVLFSRISLWMRWLGPAQQTAFVVLFGPDNRFPSFFVDRTFGRFCVYLGTSLPANRDVGQCVTATALALAMLGNWTHVAIQYTGGDVSAVQVFFNGTVLVRACPAVYPPSIGSAGIQLGRGSYANVYYNQNPTHQLFFAGEIDSANFYNASLSAIDVQALFDQGLSSLASHDTRNASNGPGGNGCANEGVPIDDIAGDGEYSCDCAGTGYVGSNCQSACFTTCLSCTNASATACTLCRAGYYLEPDGSCANLSSASYRLLTASFQFEGNLSSSVGGLEGTCTLHLGCPTYTSSMSGQAAVFDGTTTNVTLGTGSELLGSAASQGGSFT